MFLTRLREQVVTLTQFIAANLYGSKYHHHFFGAVMRVTGKAAALRKANERPPVSLLRNRLQSIPE